MPTEKRALLLEDGTSLRREPSAHRDPLCQLHLVASHRILTEPIDFPRDAHVSGHRQPPTFFLCACRFTIDLVSLLSTLLDAIFTSSMSDDSNGDSSNALMLLRVVRTTRLVKVRPWPCKTESGQQQHRLSVARSLQRPPENNNSKSPPARAAPNSLV